MLPKALYATIDPQSCILPVSIAPANQASIKPSVSTDSPFLRWTVKWLSNLSAQCMASCSPTRSLSFSDACSRSAIAFLTSEPFEVAELGDALDGVVHELPEVAHVDVVFQREIEDCGCFLPQVSLASGSRMEYSVLSPEQFAAARSFLDRHETAGTAHELRTVAEVQVERRANDTAGLAVIEEHERLVVEQSLEDIRMRELRTGCRPDPGVRLRDVDGIVHEAEFLVRNLVLEGVSVVLAELLHELDDGEIRTRDLDRVGLDVNVLETLRLDRVLQVDHEQGTAFGDDVVLVPQVPERVVEVRRRQAVDDVDNDLERVCKRCSILT